MEEEKRAQSASSDYDESAVSNTNDAGGQTSANEAGTDELSALKAEAESLRSENQELKDKALRLMAEMENLRRRTDRDKAEFSKFAISDFARELLVVGDNIRRAIEAVPKDAVTPDSALGSLIEGVEVTERELLKAFEKHQVKRFDPEGEKLNPHFHDAMTRIDVPNVAADTIVQVVQAGYMIGERVLRPAAVIVAKGGTTVETAAPAKQEKEEKIPPGAMKVPENLQAAEEAASGASTTPSGNRSEGVSSSGVEFQVERRRQSAGPSSSTDDRISQLRRQRAQHGHGGGDGSRSHPNGNKHSTLHKPVINNDKEQA